MARSFRGWLKVAVIAPLALVVAASAPQVDAQSASQASTQPTTQTTTQPSADPYILTINTPAADLTFDLALPAPVQTPFSSRFTDAAAQIVPTPGSSLLLVMGFSFAFARRRKPASAAPATNKPNTAADLPAQALAA